MNRDEAYDILRAALDGNGDGSQAPFEALDELWAAAFMSAPAMFDELTRLRAEVQRLRDVRSYAVNGITPPAGLLFEQPQPPPGAEWEITRDSAGNIVRRAVYRDWSE